MKSFTRRTMVGLCLTGLLLSGCGGSSDSVAFDQGAAFRLGAGRGLDSGSGLDGESGGPTTPGVGPGTGQPVPFNPAEQPQVLYITHSQPANTLGVYDAESYQMLDEVPVGDDPSGLSYDTERDRILVGLFGGTVVTLNANDLEEPALSTVAVPSASANLIYDPIIDAIWVSSFNINDKMAALAAETLAPLSGSPMTDGELLGSATLVLDPDGETLYVVQSAFTGAAVSVVDRATRTLLHHISTLGLGDMNEAADGLAYHPTFDHLYVGNIDPDSNDDDTLVVLDASQDPPVIIQRVACGQGPAAIAVDLTNNRVYATNFNSPTGGLSVYTVADSAAPLTFQETLPTGLQPLTVIYDEERDRILVTNFADGTLSVFDADTLDERSGSPFPVADSPNQPLLRPVTP